MNKLLILIAMIFFSSCVSQQTKSIIPETHITYLSIVKQNNCSEEIKIFNNQKDFDAFQASLEKTGPRSSSLFLVDFTSKNVAVVCKEGIEAYQIKNIEVRKKLNILNLEKIEGYENYGNTTNTLLLEVPKEIDTLELYK